MATIDLTSANTNKSTQMAKLLADGYKLLDPGDLGARARVAKFDYTADEAKAAGEFIVLAYVRKGTTILDGKIYCDGAVATADLDVGLVPVRTLDDANIQALAVALDIATAGTYGLKNGVIGTVVEEDSYIVGKLLVAGLANADVLKGYFLLAENV